MPQPNLIDNMINVVLHISLKKLFHCGVYQYA